MGFQYFQPYLGVFSTVLQLFVFFFPMSLFFWQIIDIRPVGEGQLFIIQVFESFFFGGGMPRIIQNRCTVIMAKYQVLHMHSEITMVTISAGLILIGFNE